MVIGNKVVNEKLHKHLTLTLSEVEQPASDTFHNLNEIFLTAEQLSVF
jgi:hypothetical protein